MHNRAMARKLHTHRAIDVSNMPREGHYYVLGKVIDGMDYCDAETEQWIWSIGKRYEDGRIVASLKPDLYQNKRYECLWLR
jgi:hypothetical protein